MKKTAAIPVCLLAGLAMSACSAQQPAAPATTATTTTTATSTATSTATQTASSTATTTTTAPAQGATGNASSTATGNANTQATGGAAAPCINTNLSLTQARSNNDYTLTLTNIGSAACAMEQNPVIALVSGPNDVTMIGAPAEYKATSSPFTLPAGGTTTVVVHVAGGTRPQTCGNVKAWAWGIKPQRSQPDTYVVAPLTGETLLACADRSQNEITADVFRM